jgi:hypothetical protein
MIIVLLFPIAVICRSTWRKEGIIYILLSFQCDLHENLDLIIIFFTLLQIFLFKTIYFSKYYHCSSFRLFWCISNEVKSVYVYIHTYIHWLIRWQISFWCSGTCQYDSQIISNWILKTINNPDQQSL